MQVSSRNNAVHRETIERVLLNDGAGEALCALAPSQEYPPTIEVFRQGTPAADVYFMDQGMVKLIHLTADGRELIVGLCFSGGALGVPAVMLGEAHPVSAITLTRCSLRRIPTSIFLKIVETDVGFCHYILTEHCRDMLYQVDQLAGLGLTAQERLERVLARLASVVGAADRSRSLRFPPLLKHWEIAQLIAVTPQHLSRLLKKMQEEGIIRIEKGWLIIADPDRMTVANQRQ